MSTALTRGSQPTSEEWRDLLSDILPRQGAWSEEQYLVLTDSTNRLIEFTDGYLEPLPMPTDRHQAILEFLFLALRAFIRPRSGVVRFAALRLRIGPRKFREPDVLLLLDKSDPRRQNRFWTGADLALEVVSEDKPERDLVEKRGDYAEGRVPEYWIVNPPTETITVLRLDGDAYTEAGRWTAGKWRHRGCWQGFRSMSMRCSTRIDHRRPLKNAVALPLLHWTCSG